ncbi:IS3 family transposase [Alloalcanivorax profundimaris]|uniref:IS3 family transposase n=1 Tax=Alloalcanivorax profundimaris TaxID=2735259 RepID=UPI0026A7EB6A|nr:IS3 family transposase [Alloalcanivorax profundimaris]
MRFAFIDGHRQFWPVTVLCEVLEVSRAGYYRWRHAPCQPSARRQRWRTLQAFLLEQARQQKGVPGYRKLWRDAQDAGFACGKNQVQRLLRACGYRSCVATKPGHRRPSSGLPVLPNLLNRRFTVAQPNRVWVSDITQLRCQEGWLYVAVILDLCGRQVVGRALGRVNDSGLVLRALEQAWERRQPCGEALLFHSDQGAQYRNEAVMSWLNDRGVTISMSRSGNCWDNACAESFFALLKKEWTTRLGVIGRDEMSDEIQYYTDHFYPKVRRHMTLGGLTPNAYAATLQPVST